MDQKKRLSKLLASVGIASRRASEELIFAGRVTVNGAIVKVPQTLVSLPEDSIKVDGKLITAVEKKVYFLLNKPAGLICSNARRPGEKLVVDLFEHLPYRLFTVGRLDKDTEGLLILTNDGVFANQVVHPSFNIQKEYIIKTTSLMTPGHLHALKKGTWVEGVFVEPKSVRKLQANTLSISILEGKKREIRILMASVGLPVKELRRVRIGGLRLPEMASGTFRPLTMADRQSIFGTERPEELRKKRSR